MVPMKATLTDVARRAGVSVTTASYILNGRSTRCGSPPRPRRGCEAAARAGLPAQPQRPQLAALEHGDHRADLRPRRQRSYASQLLTGASAAARAVRPPARDRRDDGRPRRGGAADRGDARAPGRRHHLRHARRLPVHGAREAARRPRGPAQLPRPERDLPAVLPDDHGGAAGRRAPARRGARGRVHVVGEDPSPEATAGP